MDDELDGSDPVEGWGLDLDTLSWLETKAGPRRLGLAARLSHHALRGRFAENVEAIPAAAARYLAEQTGRSVADLGGHDWSGREPRSATAPRSWTGLPSARSRPVIWRRSRPCPRSRLVPAARASPP